MPDMAVNGTPQWVPVKNGAGELIPAFGLMRSTGIDSDSGGLSVDQPHDSDPSGILVNSPSSIADASGGNATLHPGPIPVAYDPADGTPAVGETWGPKSGSWLLHVGGSGFKCLGGASNGVANWARITCPGYGADYTTARAGIPFASGVPSASTPLVFTDADPGCVQVVPYTAVEIPDGVDTAVVWGRLAATMTMAGTIGTASLAEVSAGVVFLGDGGDLATLDGTGIPVGWEWADDGGGGGVVSGYLLARQKYIKDGDGLAVNVARSDGYVEWYLHVDTAEAKALLGVTTVRLAWAVGLPSVGGFGASWTMDVFPTWRGPSWLTWRPACGLRDPITNALAGTCGGGSGSVSPPVPPSPPPPLAGCCTPDLGGQTGTLVIPDGTYAGTYTAVWVHAGSNDTIDWTLSGGATAHLECTPLGWAWQFNPPVGSPTAGRPSAVSCGPPMTATIPGAAFGAAGDVSVTT